MRLHLAAVREDRSHSDERMIWSTDAEGMAVRLYVNPDGQVCVHVQNPKTHQWECDRDVERRLAVLEMALIDTCAERMTYEQRAAVH